MYLHKIYRKQIFEIKIWRKREVRVSMVYEIDIWFNNNFFEEYFIYATSIVRYKNVD